MERIGTAFRLKRSQISLKRTGRSSESSFAGVAMSGFESFSAEEREALIWTGISIGLVQHAESILKNALQLAFSPGSQMTLESIASDETGLRRATLGRLLNELRRRADIAPDFEAKLDEFLQHRNVFVHGLLLDPLFSWRTTDGRERLIGFLGALAGEATIVIRVMFSAVHAFAGRIAAAHEDLRIPELSDPAIAGWLFPPGQLDTILTRK